MHSVSEWAVVAGLAAASYLIGAVPFGLLVARLKGVDVTKVGSGNIGATNVFRSVSKPLGLLTFALDAAKGWVPAWVFPAVSAAAAPGDAVPDPALGLFFAALAIAGHTWPVYLKFKGGKGVATSAGALLGIAPMAVVFGLLVWLAVFIVFRYVSAASVAASVAVPAATWWRWWRTPGMPPMLPAALTLLGILIVWRHRGNIQRLRAGTEHRFVRKRDGAA